MPSPWYALPVQKLPLQRRLPKLVTANQKLLEPLLRQLATPLPVESPQPLLCSSLGDLAGCLQAQPAAAPVPHPSGRVQLWLDDARSLGAPHPLLLAIGQQCQDLHQLLHSRALLQAALQQRLESNR